MPDKSIIHRQCLEIIESKMALLQNDLDELAAGAASDTKSTAGDKHETGRAMAQREQEQLAKQRNELQLQKNALHAIDPTDKGNRITRGSLIETDRGWFYLSIALGKIQAGNLTVLALSPQSPLGARFMGASAGAKVEFNKAVYRVLWVG